MINDRFSGKMISGGIGVALGFVILIGADKNPTIAAELWGFLQEYANTGSSRPGADICPAQNA